MSEWGFILARDTVQRGAQAVAGDGNELGREYGNGDGTSAPQVISLIPSDS